MKFDEDSPAIGDLLVGATHIDFKSLLLLLLTHP